MCASSRCDPIEIPLSSVCKSFAPVAACEIICTGRSYMFEIKKDTTHIIFIEKSLLIYVLSSVFVSYKKNMTACFVIG